MRTRPPRVAEALIRLLLPRAEHDELLGDLHERFLERRSERGDRNADLWYWTQTGASLPRLAWARVSARGRGARAHPAARVATAMGHPLRIVLREPGFTFMAASILALGIAVPTTMYSVVRGLWRELPVPHPSQVVAVERIDPSRGGASVGFAPGEFQELQAQQSVMQEVAGYRPGAFQIDGGEGVPSRVSGAAVSPSLLRLLGVEPLLGRSLVAADASERSAPVLLMGEGLWRDRHGASPGILGRSLRIDGIQRTVVGVMPDGFGFPIDQRVWIPLIVDGVDAEAPSVPVQVVARLRDEVSLEQAKAEVGRIVADGETARGDRSRTIRGTVVPFTSTFLGEGRVARALLLVVAFVLAIAAANVANLLLARAVTRTKEVAVRKALGASRADVIVQVLGETLVLTALGVAAGVALAFGGVAWFRMAFAPQIDLWWVRFELDGQALAFALACAAAATLAAGVAPALQSSGVRLRQAMRSASSGHTFRHVRFSRLSVAGQLAFSCALLILMAQVIHGVAVSGGPDDRFDAEGIVVGRLHLGSFDYPDATARDGLASELRRRLSAEAGARGVALTTTLPGFPAPTSGIALTDVPRGGEVTGPAQVRSVTPSFFRVVGAQIREGRLFQDGEDDVGEGIAVVNEALARALAPEGGAVGLRIAIEGGEAPRRIVGVVRDAGISVDGRGAGARAVFLPLEETPPTVAVLVVGASPPALRAAVAAADPRLPVEDLAPLTTLLDRSHVLGREFARLFTAFGCIALLLAIAGLYAVVAFSVSRRTREIGVRRALGAGGVRLVVATVRQSSLPVVAGVAAGSAIAFLAAPSIAPLFGATPLHDPIAFSLIPLVLGFLSLAGAAIPARRAAAVEPVQALRDA